MRSLSRTGRVASLLPACSRTLTVSLPTKRYYRTRNALQPWSAGFGLDNFFNSFDRDFNFLNNFGPFGVSPLKTNNMLKLDLKENADNYQAIFDVPGIPKDVVKVSTQNQNLTVSVDYKEESNTDDDNKSKEGDGQQGERVHWRERTVGFATRTVQLPENCDLSKCTAKQENGVLTITVPKTKEADNKRYISIE